MDVSNNENFRYVYFIESQEISRKMTLYLTENDSLFNSLEILEQTKKDNFESSFIIILYRFKIYPEKVKEKYNYEEELEIDVFARDENKNIFSTKIKNLGINYDNYIYNFKLNYEQNINILMPMEELVLDYDEKFQIFLNYLRKNNITLNSIKNDEFIYSTLKLFNEENLKSKKYEFSFLISIFMESYESKYLPKLLEIFKPEIIKSFGDVKKEKINPLINILNDVEKKIFINFEKEEKKEEIIYNFYTILLYISFKFNKEKIDEIFKNEKIKKYLFKTLLNNENLFVGLFLTKEQILELINFDGNMDFIQLTNKLKYNKDLLIILQIINEKRDLLSKKFLEKTEQKYIYIELFAFPKKDDDINAIYEQVKDLFLFEKNIKTNFVKFTPGLIEIYINLFDNVNLNKLIELNKLIIFLKKEEKQFNLKKNIDEIIHRNAILFSTKKALKNMEILNFIEKDVYYMEKMYKNSNNRSVDILTGIDIPLINDEFLNKWKKINLFEIFQNQIEIFLNKVCSLVKEMKDFNILFKLLNQNEKEDDKIEYENLSISKMQTTFELLMPTYSKEKCPNFKNEMIDLIYHSDKKKENLNNFNKEYIQVLLDVETVNEIYISLTQKYNDISNNMKNIIIDFFLNNPLNNSTNQLVDLIEKSKELRKTLLNNMRKYLITDNDIFQKEDSENYKLLKGLIEKGIFKEEENLESTEYISESLSLMKNIIDCIKKSNINYSKGLYIFQNKLETEFKNRLLLLCQSNEAQATKYFELVKKNTTDIKDALTDLQKILDDFSFFYEEKHKREIIELYEAIRNINNGKISIYINKYSDMHNKYKNKYENEIKEREILLKSVFFRSIYKKVKILNKDEEKCLQEAKDKIKKLKKIFNIGILSSLKDFFNVGDKESNEKILEMCLKSFKGKNIDEELNKEIDILAKICEINYTYDKNKICENLKLLFQKEEVLNITNSLKTFIKMTGVLQKDFYEMLNKIISNICNKKDICVIKQSMDELEHYGVLSFNNNKNNAYIQIIKKLKEQPEAIKSLLETEDETIQKMKEFNLENDSEFLTTNDILDFEKCVEFMRELGNKDKLKNMNDKELLVEFRELVKDKNKDNIVELRFNRYINNYGELKELMTRGYDKSKISRKIIGFILDNSKITLTNLKGSFLNCIYMEKDNNNNLLQKDIKIEKLLELRDRAQLSKSISGDEKEKEMIEKNQKFIEKVSEITTLYEIFIDLYKKGYPKEISVIIKITNGITEFNFENTNYNNHKELTLKLNELLDALKEAQFKAYKNKTLIRYVYGNHFYLLYNTIKKKNNLKEIYPFLQYLTKSSSPKNVENFNFQEADDIFYELIDNCEKYLNEIFKVNNLTLDKIYKKSLINKPSSYVEYKGLYIYSCDKLEKELFQIYKFLTLNIPNAQNVLLCNENTSNEEIISFLYRAILCQFNSCFIIGGIELLNSEQKFTLLEMLNNTFVENSEDMNSCLIILYTSKSTDIYKSLNLVKHLKILVLGEKDIDNQIYEGNDVEIIYSDKSGIGKSYTIKHDIFYNNNKYIHFPFGGVIEPVQIIERLKKLKLDNFTVIHLDLYDTDQIQLMMEFLFSLLIIKLYKYNDIIFYFAEKIKIKIEIPNGFIDFFAKFPILTLFLQKKINLNNLEPLYINKDINSNEQIVANYLKALKENRIDKEDLKFPMITPQFDEKKIKKLSKKYSYKLIDAQIIPDQECNKLILEALKASNNIKNPTYYQIIIFINILGTELKKFSENQFLSAFNILSLGDKDLHSIRSLIVKNFINITKYFTQGAFDDILKSQIITHSILFNQYDEEKDINNAIDNLAIIKNSGVFSFEKIDSILLFLHEGNSQGFTILTNKDNNKDKEYISFLKLYNHYKNDKKKLSKLPNFKDYKQKEFLAELKEILNLKNPIEKSEKNKLISLEEITKNYVFTSDNFSKMIFILMRIRANIPVIMMGETGCGKTALIRKLSELMNNGKTDKMKILNIHAGTTDQEIIDFIEKKVLPVSTELIKREVEKKAEKFQQNKIFLGEKLWVFLDEINTCKSMGLISELMSNNTYQGTPLPNNIIFIGACNPYRKPKNIKEEANGLDVNLAFREKENLNDKEKEKIKKNSLNSKNKLVYTVNPLPNSLLIYIFDFGNLADENEERYIENMIQEPFENIYEINKNKKQLKKNVLDNIKGLTKDMIIKSQNFIRKNNDISSVSLREIRRFNIFFLFFYKYLTNKKNHSEKLMESLQLEKEYSIYQSLTEIDLLIYSINLSIYICYYLRIVNKTMRDQLKKILTDTLTSKEISQKYNDFLYIPNLEQKFIIKNIDLEKGISKNRALLENIFSLFVTINNKVPIFIVGKPGCSKSLSVQLINKSMKGKSSSNLFFKSLPKLIINSYQGSMGSTSKGVENIFKKARDILDNLDEKEIEKNISMIFFDEMGLAEYSPNNPLKVIHSELEYDLNEGKNKIAFVGISNWKLDASKMNRGIFISIPEPDEEDIKKTAFTIGKSFNDILAAKNKVYFEHLGKLYYDYKQYLKENHNSDGKEDFHGNRDFYQLVKNCAQNMVIKYNNNEDITGHLIRFELKSIERNFAGIQFDDNLKKITSVQKVKKLLNRQIPIIEMKDEYDIIGCVKDNINDLNSRYLLIESKSSISTYLLSSLLSELNKEYIFYIGSMFKKDLKNEEYILKVLNKIQIYMENGIILIMENLDSVYPAMYDLFNQNFTVVSNKKYARLAIGSTTNTYSLVNPNFRCIINVNVNEMEMQEAPFLNRFEKQIISFNNLLNKELIDESNKIIQILKDMAKKKPMHKGLNYSLEKLLINCDDEEIKANVYDASKKGIKKENILEHILSKISLTLPQDIFLYLKFNGFSQKYRKEYNRIKEFYEKGEHINLSRFIQSMKNDKNIVYTFTNELDLIQNINNIESPLLGNINEKNIKLIKLSSINSEIEFERFLDEFINKNDNKLCIIQFTPDQGPMMNYVKYFIYNKEKEFLNRNKENNNYKKAYIFIIHVKRVFDNELKDFELKSETEKKETNKKLLKETISNLSDYYQIFIDNLNGDEKLTLQNILQIQGNEIFKKCLDFEEELTKNIYTTLFYMKYNLNTFLGGLNKETYINRLIHYIEKNKPLRTQINDCIIREITSENNLLDKVFKKPNTVTENDIDIICIIKNYLSYLYTKILNIFYFKAEKDHFFSALLSFAELENLYNQEKNDTNLISIICPEVFGEKIKRKKNNIEMDNTIKDILQNIAKIYLKNLNYNDGLIRVTEMPKANNINIILGLNLPGLKPILDRIIKTVRDEICNKYYQNEINLRESQNIGKELENDKIIYYEELARYNNSTLIEIEKEELLHLIENYYIKNENGLYIFYYILLNDYYTLYINNNFYKSNNNIRNDNIIRNDNNNQNENIIENNEENDENKENSENIKKFLKLLVNLKNKYSKNDNLDQIQMLANTINWLESYESEITILLKMFSKLNNIVPEILNEINNIILSRLINYEISDRNPEFTSIVNKVFFMGMESLLRVITFKIDKIFEKSEDNFFTLFQNTIKEVLQDAMQLNTNLNLYSKEVYSLQEIIDLIEAFNMSNIGTKENITEIVNFYNEEAIYLMNKNSIELCSKLSEFYKIIKDKIGKSKNFHKTINKILLNEFLKVFDEEYRKRILEIILAQDTQSILNSKQILKVTLKNYIIKDPSENLIANLGILSDKKKSLISSLNKINNHVFDEILLNIFEGEIFHYFESISSITNKKILEKKFNKFYKDNRLYKEPKHFNGIIFDEPFNIFKTLVEHLESIIDNEQNAQISNMTKLFSIAYIKIYLRYFVTFVKEKKKRVGDISPFVSFMNNFSKNNNNFRRVLKIYIFKLFNSLFNNFEEFKNFNYEECSINFHKEFSLWKDNKKLDVLSYCFMTLDNENDKKNYIELLKIFENYRINNFTLDEKTLVNNIKENGIDTFLCIAINKIVSNLGYEQIKNIDELDKFYEFSNKIFDEKNGFNLYLKNLLLLFFDKNKYNQRIKNKIKKDGPINSNTFEMLLYSFRFCVQSLEALDIQKRNLQNKKLLFSSIINPICLNNINGCFIPGNETQDMHLTTFEYIETHLNSSPDNVGCYVCSCGYYYSIQPCGFPTRGSTSKCPICKLDIGYGDRKIIVGYHGLVRRPGHYRIFKDENQHETCMKRYGDSDENVPNMTLANYKKNIIDPILNKGKKGISKSTKEDFLKRNKSVRQLNELSLRILNFILYSHLFFANCLNYIFDEKLKTNCLIEDMKCIEILEKSWELIKEILQGKGIQSIQIFMNLIFKRVSELVKNCEYLTDDDSRNIFEVQFESLINKCLSEYHNYSAKFIFDNKSLNEIKEDNFKTMINEVSSPTQFSNNDYPLYKYFTLTKYSNKNELIKKLGPPNIYALQYPLLHQYLLENIDVKKMKYLPAFNEFTNYMVDNYSFKISRDEAKKRILKNEKILNEKGFEKKFNNFINAWKEIKNEAIKYKCRPEMKPKELSKDDKLIYFLNDDGELGYGMYLASACQNFITWQNTFIQPIIDNVAQNGILHYFAKNMKRKIPVQSAKINQSLLIEDCFNNSLYYNFEDLISTFSRRDIFKENANINYFNYNSFVYDFASIEEELGKLLLPGKCLFENEDNLNFMAFWSEGFRGGKSDTLSTFYLKYPQKDLNDDEKIIIIKYIKKQKKKDFNPFFGSIQLIIFYLSNNIHKNDDKIISVLKKAPQYLRITDDCKKFFEKEGKEFKLDKLMNIYFFIEHLCFKDLSETLQQEYKKKIPDDLSAKITKKLMDDQNNINIGEISIKQLAAAVRRYISRYLAGKRETTDIDEKRDLTFDLTRIDLWEEKIGQLNNLDELVFSLIGEFKLIVGQAYEFYKLIEEKDINPLDEDIKNKKKK